MNRRDLKWAYADARFFNNELDYFTLLRLSHAEDAGDTFTDQLDTINDALSNELYRALERVKRIRHGGSYGSA